MSAATETGSSETDSSGVLDSIKGGLYWFLSFFLGSLVNALLTIGFVLVGFALLLDSGTPLFGQNVWAGIIGIYAFSSFFFAIAAAVGLYLVRRYL